VSPNSLTHLPDFMAAARELISRRATGVYHVVNGGAVSPFEVMRLYRDLVDPGHAFEPLAPGDLGQLTRAGRSNCVLSTEKLAREGIRLPPVRQAVEAALLRLARSPAAEGS
jgi:dTDP-4-dehydrorhamnose reductase